MSCDNIYFVGEPSFRNPGGGGEANTASNIGGGVELFKTKDLLDLQFRTFVAGDGMSISLSGDTVVFESTGGISNGTSTNNTLRWNGTNWVESNFLLNDGTKVGVGALNAGSIFNVESNTSNTVARFQNSGTGITLIAYGASDTNEAVFISQQGNAEGLYISMGTEVTGKSISIFSNKSAGDHFVINQNVGGYKDIFRIDFLGNIVSNPLKTTTPHPGSYHALFVDDTTGLVYSQAVPSGGGGTITGAANVGAGDGWWKDETSGSLRFKSLTTNSSITVVNNADDLNLSVTNPLPTGLTEQTLRHNGTNWIADNLIRNNGTNVRLNGALNSTRVLTVTDSGSTCFVPVKITGTKTTALEVEITTGSLSGAKAIDIQSTNASFNGNYINIQSTISGVKFKVDSEGAVTSDYLTSSVAHPGSFFGVFVDATTGKMYANTAGSGAAGGALPAGTGAGNLLYWNGSSWVESGNVQIDGSTFRLKNAYDLVIDNAGEIILKDLDNSNFITLTAPDTINTDYAIQLPADPPTKLGQVIRLSNIGAGSTEWANTPLHLVTDVDDNVVPSLVVGLAEVTKTYMLTGVTTANPSCKACVVGLGAQSGQFTVRAEVTAADTITVYYSYNDNAGGTIDIGDKQIHIENTIY